MRSRAWLVVGLAVALPLTPGCKRGGEAAVAESTPAQTPGGEKPVDGVGPEEAWAWVGLRVDRGERIRVTPDFVRIVTPDGDRDALSQHYGDQLSAVGWTLHRSDSGDLFRTDVYHRDDLRLILAANDEAAGGAGLGLTLGQNWAALALPRDGAVEVGEEPAVWVAVFPAGATPEQRAREFGAAVGDAGWVEDRVETGTAPDAAGEVPVVWYQRDIRALRLESYEGSDGQVKVAIQVGWR